MRKMYALTGCLDPEKFNEFKLIKRSSHLLSLLQLQSWAFQLENILVAGLSLEIGFI